MEVPVGGDARQRSALRSLASRVEGRPELEGLVLVGSMVTGETDALSDLDLIVLTTAGAFEEIWGDRCELHDPTVAACWDRLDEEGPDRTGAHGWLDGNLVLVDCLLTEPDTGVRLAEPHLVVVGPDEVTTHLVPRPPVDRREMQGVDDRLVEELDVERAYDLFKEVVRRHREKPPAADPGDGRP